MSCDNITMSKKDAQKLVKVFRGCCRESKNNGRMRVPFSLSHARLAALVLSDLPVWIQEGIKKRKIDFISRNSKCFCGSNKRFKRCCLKKAGINV